MHEILYHTFPVSRKKSEIEGILNDYCEESCDSYSPLPNPITWIEEICENQGAARKLIEDRDKNSFYGQFAVMYKDPSGSYSNKVKELETKWNEAYRKWNEANCAVHYGSTTAEYVGCKSCGSRFKRELMIAKTNPNVCAMCGADMRPETTLKRIEAYRNKTEEARVKIEERKRYEESKMPSTINWLVKTEWHV